MYDNYPPPEEFQTVLERIRSKVLPPAAKTGPASSDTDNEKLTAFLNSEKITKFWSNLDSSVPSTSAPESPTLVPDSPTSHTNSPTVPVDVTSNPASNKSKKRPASRTVEESVSAKAAKATPLPESVVPSLPNKRGRPRKNK